MKWQLEAHAGPSEPGRQQHFANDGSVAAPRKYRLRNEVAPDLRPRHAAPSAALILADVKGTERNRTPVASNTALPIAAGTTAQAGSPPPHGASFGRSRRSTTTSGTSGNVRIG